MSLPAEVTYATIHGLLTQAVAGGSIPSQGQVTFTPDVVDGLVAVGSSTPPLILTIQPVPVALASDGSLTAVVVAPADPDLNPDNWTYTVSFDLTGVTIPSFHVGPLAGGASYDLATLVPVALAGGVQGVVSATGPQGIQGIQGIPVVIAPANGTITIGGTSTAVTIAATVGVTAGTVAAGDDSRFAGSAAGTASRALAATDATTTNSRAPSGTAGGDLSGSYPNPGVAKLAGVAVTGTPTAGQVPVATSGTAATWQALVGTWTTPTLSGDWTAFTGSLAPRYALDALGFVHIEGSATGSTNAAVFTLPVGMRPTAKIAGPVALAAYSGTLYTSHLTVSSAGVVTVVGSDSTSSEYPLSLIFHAEQ